jgi:UDP-N-acetyl-D-mannosaminuronic acid dehydrogenase
MKTKENPKVCVIGMGYVGLTLAVTLHKHGISSCGVDVSEEVADGISQGKPHFYEEGLVPLLHAQLKNDFYCTTETPHDNAVRVFIVAVGTAVKRKTPQFGELNSAVRSIGRVLKRDDLVILRSTVPVGVTREYVIPLLERESGLVVGDDFSVSFAPERTIEGKALHELKTLPQIIGGFDEKSIKRTRSIFETFAPRSVIVGSLEEAEMIKLLNNTYRDFNFAFANEFALACNALNIDTTRVIRAANDGYARDPIPLPSPGVGGYCLTKDPHLLSYSTRRKGYQMRLPLWARGVNESMPAYVFSQIERFFDTYHKNKKTRHVSILGFAFKGTPPTSDIRFSPTLDLLALLKENSKYKISGHDFVVSESEVAELGIRSHSDVADAFRETHCVVVMNNHPRYGKLPIKKLTQNMRSPGMLVDTWSLYDPKKVTEQNNMYYSNLGFDTLHI